MLRKSIAIVTLAALSSGFASAQTVLLHEDFENGLGNWSATALWHTETESSPCGVESGAFPSSITAARFGRVTANSCDFNGSAIGDLTLLAPISIPSTATDVRLRYWTFEETECPLFQGYFGNCGWDHRFVSVSNDGGQNWTDVAFGAEELAWHEKSVVLDAYRGQDILLRFRFDPVDNLWNDGLGWFVDEVRVEYGVPSPLTYCTAKLNSVQCTPTLVYTGWPTMSGADDFRVGAVQILNHRYAKLVWSRSTNAVPFHGGTLCVLPPAARTPVLDPGGTPLPSWDCTGVYWHHFSYAYLASKGVAAGDTIYIQFSGRDPLFSPPYNHSLSAGLQVTFLP
jgi:hypothetical protein